jgi:hypothetical protein
VRSADSCCRREQPDSRPAKDAFAEGWRGLPDRRQRFQASRAIERGDLDDDTENLTIVANYNLFYVHDYTSFFDLLSLG